jgi:hypothetical protein
MPAKRPTNACQETCSCVHLLPQGIMHGLEGTRKELALAADMLC